MEYCGHKLFLADHAVGEALQATGSPAKVTFFANAEDKVRRSKCLPVTSSLLVLFLFP